MRVDEKNVCYLRALRYLLGFWIGDMVLFVDSIDFTVTALGFTTDDVRLMIF